MKLLTSTLVTCLSTASLLAQDTAEMGKSVYMQVCVACHQPTGAGLPPVFPPLTNTEYVNGSAERMIAIVLKGVMGPIVVNGQNYANMMPPQEAMLSDDKIAAVLTYVRSSFGNTASPVSKELVAATRAKLADRKTSWTEAELKAWTDSVSK